MLPVYTLSFQTGYMKRFLSRIFLLQFLLLAASPLLLNAQDYIQMGLRERQPTKQIEYFTKALNERKSKKAYYHRAWAYIAQNQVNNAMRDLLAGLEAPQHPNRQYAVANTFINSDLCYLYYLIGKYDESIQYGNKALSEYPENARAHRFRGWSYMNLESYTLAKKDFDAYVALDPSEALRYYQRSILLYRMEDYAAALKDINKALELDGQSNNDYLEQKSLVLNQLGREQEAQELIQEIVDFKKDDPISMVNVGKLYARNGEQETAISYYNLAMKLYEDKLKQDPRFRDTGRDQLYEIFLSRGNAYYAQEVYQKALGDYYKAAEAKPEDHVVWYQIGAMQTDRRNFEEAINAFEKCFHINPEYPYGWINLGFAYGELDQREKAIQTYDRALRIDNVSGKGLIYNNRGFSYLEMGKYDKARRDMEAAIAEDPEIAMSHISLGEYFHEVEQYDKAIEKFNFALNMPNRSDRETMVAYYKRGLAYYKKGDLEQAIIDLEAAVHVDLEHMEASLVEAQELLGIVYYENEQLCDAQQALKKALRWDRDTRFDDAKEAALYLQKVTAKDNTPCR